MGTIRKRILTAAVGLLLAAGVPYVAATTVHADPGSGCGCDSGCGQGKGCDCGGYKGMHGKEGGHMHGMHMAGGGPMKEEMTRHMEEMRGTILKLRALEAKMEALKSKDDAAFRAASLEHAKLLTDLEDSHLKHMEGMMGGK
jgi:hypothetical protein